MSEGVVSGGWSFVITAYAITAAGLLAYLGTLWSRRRNQDRDTREKTE